MLGFAFSERPSSAHAVESSDAPDTSLTHRWSGFRKQRLDGKYGLGSKGVTGVGASSGFTSRMPLWKVSPDHRASSRRSARSPMPQLA